MQMDRRSFLTGIAALAGGAAVENAIPFWRKWFFPKKVTPVNVWRIKYIVPSMSDYVFQNEPLLWKVSKPGFMMLESTSMGRGWFRGWLYDQYLKSTSLRVSDDQLDGLTQRTEVGAHFSEVGRWPQWAGKFVQDSDCDPSRLYCLPASRPESKIVACPVEGIRPVKISAALVQEATESDLLPQPFRRERLVAGRSLRDAVQGFVWPIARSVQDALDELEDGVSAIVSACNGESLQP